MATNQFKGPSPFEEFNKDRRARFDRSDFKYQQYMDSVITPERYSSVPDDLRVVRLALIGAGRAGTIHLKNIVANPRIDLVYIVEADTARWEEIRVRWNLKDGTTFLKPEDVSRVYADPSVHAVMISTPTFTHEDYIRGALAAKKAVLSEKPISQSFEGTKACYAAAKENGKPLLCAFNRRFEPSFADLRRRTQGGEVGHVQIVKTTSRDSPLPPIEYLKISGGIFHDCAVHDIDLMTWVIGELPVEVFSVANSQMPEIGALGDFDNVVMNLKFASGTIGMIDLSRYSNYGYDQRLEVFGPKGMIHIENDAPQRAVKTDITSTEGTPMYYSFPSRYKDAYQIELDHFLDIVQGVADQPIVDLEGRSTLAVSRIATACEESARSGKVVKLDWTEADLPPGYNKV